MLKKTLPIVLLLLALPLAAAWAQNAETDPAAEPEASAAPAAEDASAEEASMPPLFSLEPQEGDSPQLLQTKAALRLFKAYNVTVGLLVKCRASYPEAAQALSNFNSRNGRTVSNIMAVIRRGGGINPDIKKSLDMEITSAINSSELDCASLAAEVQAGGRDLYKAEIYAEDYSLMRGRN